MYVYRLRYLEVALGVLLRLIFQLKIFGNFFLKNYKEIKSIKVGIHINLPQFQYENASPKGYVALKFNEKKKTLQSEINL